MPPRNSGDVALLITMILSEMLDSDRRVAIPSPRTSGGESGDAGAPDAEESGGG